MKNTNTRFFWNKKIKNEKTNLIRSPIYRHKNKIVIKYLRNAEGKILDIGLGYGIIESQLSKNKSKLQMYGIDISDVAIANVRSVIKGKFIVASALKIPFSKEKFDYILALDVLEHFQKKELNQILTQINKILKKGGKLIVSVPINEQHKDTILNRHLTIFTEEKLLDLFLKYNFKILKKELLYAFRKFYFIKNILVKYLKLREPNLLIVIGIKK